MGLSVGEGGAASPSEGAFRGSGASAASVEPTADLKPAGRVPSRHSSAGSGPQRWSQGGVGAGSAGRGCCPGTEVGGHGDEAGLGQPSAAGGLCSSVRATCGLEHHNCQNWGNGSFPKTEAGTGELAYPSWWLTAAEADSTRLCDNSEMPRLPHLGRLPFRGVCLAEELRGLGTLCPGSPSLQPGASWLWGLPSTGPSTQARVPVAQSVDSGTYLRRGPPSPVTPAASSGSGENISWAN